MFKKARKSDKKITTNSSFENLFINVKSIYHKKLTP